MIPALPDLLSVEPFPRPATGSAAIPGSKSLTNRALLLAALCAEPVELQGTLHSEDTDLMVAALQQLGVRVEVDTQRATMRVSDQARAFTSSGAELFVGLAGTAARFLTALCAAAPQGTWVLDGVPQMRKRPMRGLIEALRQLGADIRCRGEEGFFPLEIRARGLAGGLVRIDASESSQMLSALLMVAPLAQQPVEIELAGAVRWPFVQMTARMMEHFGQPTLRREADGRIRPAVGQRYQLRPPAEKVTAPAGWAQPAGAAQEHPSLYRIEPDATAASYFAALPLVAGGEILLPGLRGPGEGLQGDTVFTEVLAATGMQITSDHRGLRCAYRSGEPRLGRTTDFREFSDTFLTLAALSPLLQGTTRITGIAHTRKQETDRVAGMARELRKLGQDVREEEDTLTIEPRPLPATVEIDTYGDHRFAMSFAILGCHDRWGDGRPWLAIRQPACCAKTFPHFFALLAEIRRKSLEA